MIKSRIAAGAALLVVLDAAGVAVRDAAIAGVIVTTAIRLLAVRYDWRFPEQQALVLRRRNRRAA